MRTLGVAAAAVAVIGLACRETGPVPATAPSFSRPAQNPRAVFEYPTDDAALKIRSDHRFLSADGSMSVYDDGVCGVEAQIYAFGSGDATMDPDAHVITGQQRATCGDARSLTVIFDTPADANPPPTNPVATGGYFENMNDLWQAPIGVEIESETGYNVSRCLVRFKPSLYPGSDKVLVLRVDASTWRVRTKPFPDDKAWCDTEQRFYHLPFQVTVGAK